jgi:hypothetical protein
VQQLDPESQVPPPQHTWLPSAQTALLLVTPGVQHLKCPGQFGVRTSQHVAQLGLRLGGVRWARAGLVKAKKAAPASN